MFYARHQNSRGLERADYDGLNAGNDAAMPCFRRECPYRERQGLKEIIAGLRGLLIVISLAFRVELGRTTGTGAVFFRPCSPKRLEQLIFPALISIKLHFDISR